MGKYGYYVEPKGALTRAACIFMALSAAMRSVWLIKSGASLDTRTFWIQAVLPTVCCLAFIVLLRFCGKKAFYLSFIPTFLGVLFFILKAAGFVWWHQALCTLLYLAVAVLYGLVCFGILPLRRLLIPLFGLPLAFHVFVEDLIVNRRVYDLDHWLQEGSVLCIMAGLLCVSCAIKLGGNRK